MSHRNLEIVQSTRSFHNNVNIILFSISKIILNNARSFHANNVEIVSMKLMQENIFSLVRMKKLLLRAFVMQRRWLDLADSTRY